MQITDLDQIRERYEHVYLSPHLDDAALSCGGAILRQRQADERVLVVTLCTAAPDPQGPFSELALEFHQNWGLDPAEVVAARLREDALAMQRIDADYYWAGMPDAIYRYPQAYDTRASLFGPPAPDDPLLPTLRQFIHVLREYTPGARLYAPLGIGEHVDHQITYTAAIASAPVACYEDIPYVTKPGAFDQRMGEIAEQFEVRAVDISATLAQKLQAISAYASQLGELFGGVAAMERVVASYAQADHAGGAAVERLWVREL